MPAKYHPVAPAIWDRTMRELPQHAQLVRLYVLSCPSRVSEGLFTLPVGIVAHDTGLDEATVLDALDILDAVGLVSYDEQAEVVLDRTALRFTPLRNGERGPDKRISGAVRLFENVPDSPLKGELLTLAAEHSPDLHTALSEESPRCPDEGPSESLPSPLEAASVFPEAPSDAHGSPEKSRAEPERDGVEWSMASRPRESDPKQLEVAS